MGARPHYQSQEVVQQPRPVPLQVKGWAVGQREDGSCGRRVGVSIAGPGPIGKLGLGTSQGGQAVPVSRDQARTLTTEVAALTLGPESVVAGGGGAAAAQGLEQGCANPWLRLEAGSGVSAQSSWGRP